MSDSSFGAAERSPSIAADAGLQFNTVEAVDAAQPVGQRCALCSQPVGTTFYAVADKLLCPACAAAVAAPPAGNKVTRFLRASLLGLGAGLVGALAWFLVRHMLNLELGLVALLVGFLVGNAVRKGSHGVGGLGYQALAVLITYACIGLNYTPDVVEAMLQGANRDRAPAAQGNGQQHVAQGGDAVLWKSDLGPIRATLRLALILVFSFGLALALPFLAGAENLIGIIIIGIALWEAWKLAAARRIAVSGPYQIGDNPAV